MRIDTQTTFKAEVRVKGIVGDIERIGGSSSSKLSFCKKEHMRFSGE